MDEGRTRETVGFYLVGRFSLENGQLYRARALQRNATFLCQ